MVVECRGFYADLWYRSQSNGGTSSVSSAKGRFAREYGSWCSSRDGDAEGEASCTVAYSDDGSATGLTDAVGHWARERSDGDGCHCGEGADGVDAHVVCVYGFGYNGSL